MRNLTYYATTYASGETTLPPGDVIWFQDPDGEGDVYLNGPAIIAILRDAQLNSQLVGEALDQEALNRDWCFEYQNFVSRLNEKLMFPLPQPQVMHCITVDIRTRYMVNMRAPMGQPGEAILEMHEASVTADRILRAAQELCRRLGAGYVEHEIELVSSENLDG